MGRDVALLVFDLFFFCFFFLGGHHNHSMQSALLPRRRATANLSKLMSSSFLASCLAVGVASVQAGKC